MRNLRQTAVTMALAGLLAVGPAAFASTSNEGANDANIQGVLSQKLQQKSEFKNVQSTVENGTVVLTGSVETYKQKLDAEKLARKSGKQVKDVRDLVQVSSSVPDDVLRQKLAKALAYGRVGFGETPFDVITLKVNNGVVRLGGQVVTYVSYQDALATVQNTKGVKDVISTLKVAPTSNYDNALRARLFRAIYGDSVLSKYWMDPVKPIRILVKNGHVALYGRVDNKMDVEIAGIRAGGVFGGFSVQNHLTTDQTDVVR